MFQMRGSNSYHHIPVLLEEVLEQLDVKEGKKYIDGTLGGGGYTFEIAKRGGNVLSLDLDQDAIEFVNEKIKDQKSNIKELENIRLVHGNFRDIKKIAEENGFEKVAGIVLDIGISSYHLEGSGRGFTFRKDEPLDMRMDMSTGISAKDIINTWKEDALYEIISQKGEEHYARAISHNIVVARRVKPITTTKELADIVSQVVKPSGMIHPATKTFQALRIVVNDELENLKRALADGIDLLESGGKFIVVSFHSLEDRIVKRQFQKFEIEKKGIALKKIIIAGSSELERNRRARSAKMRVLNKL